MTSDLDRAKAPIRVVVTDDQALIRRGLTLMLSAEPDIEVVAQACDGVEAVEMVQRLRPDVVLMDLHMPRKGGVAATREILQLVPGTRVLVLTTFDTDESVFEAVRAGADAYLLKDASEDEVLETVRAVQRGESRLTPQIARKVIDQFRRLASVPEVPPEAGGSGQFPASRAPNKATSAAETLTEKEEKVLDLIAEGKSNKEIGAALFLAEGTVKNYVSRIMEKLHANSRTQLAVMSLRQRRTR
jgi:DNA-binding NarL/FixJ family response regulator